MSISARDTVLGLANGWTVVGVTAVQAVAFNLPNGNYKGVLFKAPGTTDDTPNTAPVYIGANAGVTADTDPTTDGFPLAPGESLTLPIEQATTLYAISGSGSQLLAWIMQ